jgi:hypothetical protein
MRYVSPSHLMGAYSVINVLLLSFGVLATGWTGLWCIFASSFFMPVMYPTIFALGIDNLGEKTKIGSSVSVVFRPPCPGVSEGSSLTCGGYVAAWGLAWMLVSIWPRAILVGGGSGR